MTARSLGRPHKSIIEIWGKGLHRMMETPIQLAVNAKEIELAEKPAQKSGAFVPLDNTKFRVIVGLGYYEWDALRLQQAKLPAAPRLQGSHGCA
jgi:hypothetical protein